MNAWTLALGNLSNLAPVEALKTCGRCKQDKPLSSFYRMGGRISYACKVCHRTAVYARRRCALANVELTGAAR